MAVSFASRVEDTLYNSVRNTGGRLDSTPYTVALRLSRELVARYAAAARLEPSSGDGRAQHHAAAAAGLLSRSVQCEVLFHDGQQPWIYCEDVPHRRALPRLELTMLSLDEVKGSSSGSGGGGAGAAGGGAGAGSSSAAQLAQSGYWILKLGVERRLPLSSAHGGESFRLAFMFDVPASSTTGGSTGAAAPASAAVPAAAAEAVEAVQCMPPGRHRLLLLSSTFKALAKQGVLGSQPKLTNASTFEQLSATREAALRDMVASCTQLPGIQTQLCAFQHHDGRTLLLPAVDLEAVPAVTPSAAAPTTAVSPVPAAPHAQPSPGSLTRLLTTTQFELHGSAESVQRSQAARQHMIAQQRVQQAAEGAAADGLPPPLLLLQPAPIAGAEPVVMRLPRTAESERKRAKGKKSGKKKSTAEASAAAEAEDGRTEPLDSRGLTPTPTPTSASPAPVGTPAPLTPVPAMVVPHIHIPMESAPSDSDGASQRPGSAGVVPRTVGKKSKRIVPQLSPPRARGIPAGRKRYASFDVQDGGSAGGGAAATAAIGGMQLEQAQAGGGGGVGGGSYQPAKRQKLDTASPAPMDAVPLLSAISMSPFLTPSASAPLGTAISHAQQQQQHQLVNGFQRQLLGHNNSWSANEVQPQAIPALDASPQSTPQLCPNAPGMMLSPLQLLQQHGLHALPSLSSLALSSSNGNGSDTPEAFNVGRQGSVNNGNQSGPSNLASLSSGAATTSGQQPSQASLSAAVTPSFFLPLAGWQGTPVPLPVPAAVGTTGGGGRGLSFSSILSLSQLAEAEANANGGPANSRNSVKAKQHSDNKQQKQQQQPQQQQQATGSAPIESQQPQQR